jgi:peptidyl-Lys metalloendopeptidase
MSWNSILKSALAVTLATLAMGAQAAPKGVTVTVEPEKHSLAHDEDVLVKVTITNTSSSPQYVLKSRTPFEGVEAPLFDITRDGDKVPYLGALIKRPAPTAADYYLLKPGASHTVRVELSSLYDMSVTGDYAISYRTSGAQLLLDSPPAAGVTAAAAKGSVDEIASQPASIWISGSLPRGATPLSIEKMKADAGMVGPASVSYASCTASQQSTIASAMSAGLSMATSGSNYMNAGAISTRYTKWFGARNSSREATVKSHFTAIKDAFATKPVVVDCSCKQNYYAYVYPTQPYKVYVCKAFWTAPMTGTDSKGGTLVHEISHFNVVAGTDDHVYGQSGAASLAISNPAQAIDNADSHEYFGENTPALQ